MGLGKYNIPNFLISRIANIKKICLSKKALMYLISQKQKLVEKDKDIT